MKSIVFSNPASILIIKRTAIALSFAQSIFIFYALFISNIPINLLDLLTMSTLAAVAFTFTTGMAGAKFRKIASNWEAEIVFALCFLAISIGAFGYFLFSLSNILPLLIFSTQFFQHALRIFVRYAMSEPPTSELISGALVLAGIWLLPQFAMLAIPIIYLASDMIFKKLNELISPRQRKSLFGLTIVLFFIIGLVSQQFIGR